MATTSLKLTPILVKEFDLGAELTREMRKATLRISNGIKRDLLSPTRTWDDKPVFSIRRTFGQTKIEVEVFLRGESWGNQLYTWIDEGVEPHEIKPAEGGVLAFPEASDPKTRPGSLMASSGQRSKEMIVTPRPVITSIRGRFFVDQVSNMWDERFYEEVDAIFAKLAQEYGVD